jgi:hypothetical protein
LAYKSGMRVIRIVTGGSLVLATLVSLAGCGSSSDGGGGGAGASELHPPASIDLTVCAGVTGDEFDSATLQACGTCCSNASFQASTIYANKCVCGQVVNDDNICKTQADAACGPCCTNAGYSGYSFFGDPGSSTCSCEGKFDDKVCAPTLGASDPEPACRVCCLNNGYVGEEFVGIGAPECGCT